MEKTSLMLDNLTPEQVTHISIKSLEEKGRRIPLHSVHRWWSRRFSALYRGILSAYLLDRKETELFYEGFNNPQNFRIRAQNKTFFEPFCGGGTGISEAYLFGYDVYGVDVNPLATRIVGATLSLLRHSHELSDLETVSVDILDRTLRELKNFWIYKNKIISYIFVTKSKKVPSWITVYTQNKNKNYILRCPKCGNIFTIHTKKDVAMCPLCNYEFKVTHKPEFKIKRSSELPRANKKWKVWAVEVRNPDKNWKKEVVSPELDGDLYFWLHESAESLEGIVYEIETLLNQLDLTSLIEGQRLQREGIKSFSELYSWRQLITFKRFAELSKDLPNIYKLLFSIALSESAKSSSFATKWYSPIGEPVPAGAMKTYWIPTYTVETNPLAHVWGHLRPLARNSIASALRNQVKVITSFDIREHNNKKTIVQGDSELVPYPHTIDLAVVDPPYMDSVRSYTSLALVHYGPLFIFDNYADVSWRHIDTYNLAEIESNEIPRTRKEYENKLTKILSNINNHLNQRRGRVVVLYNRKSQEDWFPVINAIKNARFYPTLIFWTLGESPGGLARSKLKGLFCIVLRPHKVKKIRLTFTEPLETLSELKGISLSPNVETAAYEGLKATLQEVYPHIHLIEH